ncbi:MAG: hypothetical protein ABIG61_07200 [Planctomycetota bacterium]
MGINIKELKRMITELKELKDSTDPEVAHCSADDILAEALQTISPKSKLVSELIKAYNKVPKWYA